MAKKVAERQNLWYNKEAKKIRTRFSCAIRVRKSNHADE